MNNYNRLTCDIRVGNEFGDLVRFNKCIEAVVETSFDTLTDTAKIKLPRDNQWIVRNAQGINEGVLIQSSDFEKSGIFRKGNTIQIRLGYDFKNEVVFDGFITGITPQSPFEITCEDATWKLKQKRISFSTEKDKNTLFEIVSKLLPGTGVSLHPDTKPLEIEFGRVRIDNSTVAELLNEWRKRGVLCFIRDGKLVVGRSYYSDRANVMKTSNDLTYFPPTFNLEYDVVKDNLQINTLDKKFVAVRGVSKFKKNNKTLVVTVVLNPNSEDDEFLVIEHLDGRKTLAQQQTDASNIQRNLKTTVVNIEEYQTRTIHYSEFEYNDLIEAIKGDFFKLVDTGFKGDFVAFGDHNLQPATTCNIFDPTNPEKNGEFVIKSVKKVWGQQGFRQTVQLSHKYRNFEPVI